MRVKTFLSTPAPLIKSFASCSRESASLTSVGSRPFRASNSHMASPEHQSCVHEKRRSLLTENCEQDGGVDFLRLALRHC